MKKILIVEDEDIQQMAVEKKLADAGFMIMKAKNGEEGLRLVQEEKPDLLLTDIMMPKMDGMHMLRTLRKNDWGKSTKIIILSNMNDEANIEESKNLGVLKYFVKSNTTLEELTTYISSVLS